MKPWKRLFDVLLAIIGLILLTPVFAGVAIAVKLDDGGPIFFRQERVGQYGRPFSIWKFRSMCTDAERQGAQITTKTDSRITRVGRLLRRSKLDELPQMLNVLMGEMSFVGPRPEVTKYVELYTPAQRRVLALRPGITDPASLAFMDEDSILSRFTDPEGAYVKIVMPQKIAQNVSYAERATLVSDVSIIMGTLTSILKKLL